MKNDGTKAKSGHWSRLLIKRREMSFIEQLKSNQQVNRYSDETGNYGILVLGRGENLFFQQNERAFICEIEAVKGIINSKTISKWDNGEKIQDKEKAYVLDKLIFLYRKFYNVDAEIFPFKGQ